MLVCSFNEDPRLWSSIGLSAFGLGLYDVPGSWLDRATYPCKPAVLRRYRTSMQRDWTRQGVRDQGRS